MRLGTADVLVRAKTDKFNKDIDKSEKKVKSFSVSGSKSLAGLSKSFVSLAGLAGIGALTASLAGVVMIGARFEKQMATVRGVMRANEKDFKRLSDAAKKMGATTEWSATQAAEALNYMGMAGWSVKDSIEALPEVLNLATSGSLDLGRASDIVTDSLTAMGLGVQDLSRFNDILTGTFTRTNTTVEMIGETLKYVAPIASAMGYEIEELAAMLGTLAQSGIKASDAGTDLRQAFIKNASAAKVLGTEADDLIGTLEAAKKAGWGVAEMTKHYGLIALKSVLKLTDNLDLYEELAEQLHNVAGETKELADIKLDTLIGDFDILKSSVEGLGNTVYASIVTPIRWFVRITTEDITEINNAVKALQVTWGALGLYSVGILDLNTAIFDGVAALETFEEALGPEKLRLAFLERVIATGKYTSKVYWEAKKLRELIDALPDIDVAKTKDDKPSVVTDTDTDPKVTDSSWIKNMQAQEAFALKMAESEQSRLNARYELETEINAKIHDDLLSDTDFRLQELDKQFLAADNFVKDKALLDEWYVKKYQEIMEGISRERLDAQKDFNAQYTAMGKSTFDVEREQLTQQIEAWREYGFDKEKIAKLTVDKLKKINEAETKQRINSIQSVAGSMADGFKMISEMGGKHSKEAFATYKAFKIAETIISTYSGAMKAYEALVGIPYVGPALGVAAAAAVTAFGMSQVSMISSAQPPSYDLGGISEAKGIYQTGDIAEAHIPIPSGGRIPVEMKSDNQISPKPMIVNIHEAPGTQTRVEQSDDGQSLEVIIEQVEQSMQSRMSRGTGMAPFMDGRYGRAY